METVRTLGPHRLTSLSNKYLASFRSHLEESRNTYNTNIKTHLDTSTYIQVYMHIRHICISICIQMLMYSFTQLFLYMSLNVCISRFYLRILPEWRQGGPLPCGQESMRRPQQRRKTSWTSDRGFRSDTDLWCRCVLL